MGSGRVSNYNPPEATSGQVFGTAESYGPFLMGAPEFGIWPV
jgi:hypothetical protein